MTCLFIHCDGTSYQIGIQARARKNENTYFQNGMSVKMFIFTGETMIVTIINATFTSQYTTATKRNIERKALIVVVSILIDEQPHNGIIHHTQLMICLNFLDNLWVGDANRKKDKKTQESIQLQQFHADPFECLLPEIDFIV